MTDAAPLPTRLRALLVEDNPGDVALIRAWMDDDPSHPLSLHLASTCAKAIELLRSQSFDVIALDLGLPDSVGIETLDRIRVAAPLVPVLVLTGQESMQTATRCLARGAEDYLVKGRAERVLPWALHLTVSRAKAKSALGEFVRLRMSLMDFAASHSLSELLIRVLDETEELTGSLVSFFHFLEPDQQTLSLQAWSTRTTAQFCKALGQGLHYPVDRAGVWVDCVRQRQPVIHNDYAGLTHRQGLPEGHSPVIRELVVPILRAGTIVAVLGVGNKATDYTQQDVDLVTYFADIAWEIAERKRAEEAVLRERDFARRVLESVADGIFLAHDDSVRPIIVNQRLCEMLGYSRDELRGLTLRDLYLPPASSRLAETTPVAPVTTVTSHNDVPVQCQDGSAIICDIQEVAISIEGRPAKLVCLHDATERRHWQSTLAQSDRLASMGMLAAGVAHEINNPLSYVLYNLESALEELAMPSNESLPRNGEASGSWRDDVRPRISDALEGALRIRDISRVLGTFSRVEDKKLSQVSLRQAIDHAAAMAHNEIKYRARFVKDFGPVPPVLASEGRLAQVFLNLFINASHAIGEGATDLNEIRVRTYCDDSAVFAEVSDTGKGISAAHLQRIFEPFFTTKDVGVGSGLGLAISKSIITDFEGEITVESKEGEGTRFLIRLPRKKWDADSNLPDLRNSLSPPGRPGRVLIVDEEESIRAQLRRLLGKYHEVVEAASGRAAQALLEQDSAFDAILCDVMMPQMSGVELHRWLVVNHKGLSERLVFISGGAFTPKAKDYLASVSNLHLEKPLDSSLVLGITNTLVAAHTPSDSNKG